MGDEVVELNGWLGSAMMLLRTAQDHGALAPFSPADTLAPRHWFSLDKR